MRGLLRSDGSGAILFQRLLVVVWRGWRHWGGKLTLIVCMQTHHQSTYGALTSEVAVTDDEIEAMIIDERDPLVDEWAFSGQDDDGALLEPGQIILKYATYEECRAIVELAFEVLEAQKRDFVELERFDRGTEGMQAAYKVVVMRDLLRQVMPFYIKLQQDSGSFCVNRARSASGK